MGRKRYLVQINCGWCNALFQPKNSTRRFCSTSCRSKMISSTPEARDRSRKSMHRVRHLPEVQRKLQAHLQGPTNPFRDPQVQQRAHATLRAKGYPQLNGGNGRGPTLPQQMLCEALGTGWVLEHIQGTSPRPPSYPTHYKIDIANPQSMIAVEVHGRGHGRHGIPTDHKKRKYLESRGWTVLWVWNHEILDDLSGILKRVRETTSPTVS